MREHAVKMTVREIMLALEALGSPARSVVLSGGNPALLHLGPLVAALRESGRRVAVETQGSKWRSWLRSVDVLVVSPKPPSSGMATIEHSLQFRQFMREAHRPDPFAARPVLKVVVFDEDDYVWARALREEYPGHAFYVSAGTPVATGRKPYTRAFVTAQVLKRFSWLAGQVAQDEAMRDVVVLPQLHVLAFGVGRGV